MPLYVPPPKFNPGVCGEFRATERFAVAWSFLWANWGLITGAVLLAWVIQLVVSFIPFIGGIAGLFLAPLMTAAGYQAVLTFRGQPAKAGDIFQVFGPKYWQVFVVTLLYNLCFMVAVVPLLVGGVLFAIGASQGGAVGAAMIALGCAVFLVSMIGMMYIQARLMHAPLLIYDAPAGSLDMIECLKMSWGRTGPFAWSLVGFLLLMALVAMGSILLLGIGLLLVGIPFAVACTAVAYCTLFPQSSPLCPKCGYDLSRIGGPRCPECGWQPPMPGEAPGIV
ncbi:MAG: hypothetical protein DYG92_08805 [Leptolyngbya sp. PLA1]|nr:hypothetical protein [Leptolyngbya sp. PLA1]